jgi:hypothetical protein
MKRPRLAIAILRKVPALRASGPAISAAESPDGVGVARQLLSKPRSLIHRRLSLARPT